MGETKPKTLRSVLALSPFTRSTRDALPYHAKSRRSLEGTHSQVTAAARVRASLRVHMVIRERKKTEKKVCISAALVWLIDRSNLPVDHEIVFSNWVGHHA